MQKIRFILFNIKTNMNLFGLTIFLPNLITILILREELL